MNLLIGGDSFAWAILFLMFLAFGVPIILLIIGLVLWKKNKKRSKVFLISAVVYALIGLGMCGIMFR